MTKTASRWHTLRNATGRLALGLALTLPLLGACAPFGAESASGRPASAAGAAESARAPGGAAGGTSARVATGAVTERELVGTAPPLDIDRASRRFYVYGNALPAQSAVDWYQVRFTTADGQGNVFPVTAQLLVPRTAQPAELPVYVFGPGTTGLGEGCAPSRERALGRDWGDFEAHLLSYASRGYVTVMPDYAGFADPVRHQYYYVAEMHAHVMLDAARAAVRFFDGAEPPSGVRVANAIFFAGYSQGGHAAFVARDAAPRYAPELGVKGAIAYGGRGDVVTLLSEFPVLAPYILFAYSRYYGTDKVDPAQILAPRWLPTLEADVTALCIDEMGGYYGDDPRRIFRPEFLAALQSGRLGQEYPALQAVLEQNNAGPGSKDVPVLFLQGLADTTVTPQTSRAYLRRICDAGGRATYLTYENIPHNLTRQVSYRDTLDWMGNIMQGRQAPSDC